MKYVVYVADREERKAIAKIGEYSGNQNIDWVIDSLFNADDPAPIVIEVKKDDEQKEQLPKD